MRLAVLIEFAVLFFTAAVIVRRLYISKDGKLRLIMMGVFGADAIMDAGWFVVVLAVGESMLNITLTTLFILYLPKLVVKIWFYTYLIKLPKK